MLPFLISPIAARPPPAPKLCRPAMHGSFRRPAFIFRLVSGRASAVGCSRSGGSARSPDSRAEELEERVRNALWKLDISASSYDTAWVAMVPAPGDPRNPCFLQCVEWILRNQHEDGSWGLVSKAGPIVKDALSCTLACVLALKRWDIGDELVRKGLHYIGNNISGVWNDENAAPIGFDIIFPGMLGLAIDMGLDVPVHETSIQRLFALRNADIQSITQSLHPADKAYLAYVAEGLGGLFDWSEIMIHQRKNGSLFNSPSATAAALPHVYNCEAFHYLNSVLQKCHSSVPVMYPWEMYHKLCTIDRIEQMGVAEQFKSEIKRILDEVYSCWLQGDEEIMCDATTCFMAFRLLRLNGYEVSSDVLSHHFGDYSYSNQRPHSNDIKFEGPVEAHGNAKMLLELYKASQIRVSSNEHVLDKLMSCTSNSLRKMLSKSGKKLPPLITKEVEIALRFPSYADLERIAHRRNIQNYYFQRFEMLKSSYMYCHYHEDLLGLAAERFNSSQFMYRKELRYLERWIKEYHLHELEFARQKLLYCYFSVAATMCFPNSEGVRISWAKNSVLTTVVDDFFDVGGSKEELESLISLVEKWDGMEVDGYASNHVKIIYSAIYATVSELGMKASAVQNRCVTGHLIEIWLSLLKSMMNEANWQRNEQVPPVEQYLANGVTSFALGPIILPALYFVGPELSEEAVAHSEYSELFRLVSTCGRLLNDIQGFERESLQGKLNAVSLCYLKSSGADSIEDIKKELKNTIDTCRGELLGLVLREQTVIPRPCKELFWKMSKILHLFYMNTDGFSSPKEMLSAVNAIIHDPLNMPSLVDLDMNVI